MSLRHPSPVYLAAFLISRPIYVSTCRNVSRSVKFSRLLPPPPHPLPTYSFPPSDLCPGSLLRAMHVKLLSAVQPRASVPPQALHQESLPSLPSQLARSAHPAPEAAAPGSPLTARQHTPATSIAPSLVTAELPQPPHPSAALAPPNTPRRAAPPLSDSDIPRPPLLTAGNFGAPVANPSLGRLGGELTTATGGSSDQGSATLRVPAAAAGTATGSTDLAAAAAAAAAWAAVGRGGGAGASRGAAGGEGASRGTAAAAMAAAAAAMAAAAAANTAATAGGVTVVGVSGGVGRRSLTTTSAMAARFEQLKQTYAQVWRVVCGGGGGGYVASLASSCRKSVVVMRGVVCS